MSGEYHRLHKFFSIFVLDTDTIETMTGTLLNTAAIIVGSLLGMMIRSHLSEKMVKIAFQGIGLFTLTVGISMALRSENLIVAVVSIVAGALIGQWIDIDRRLRCLSDYIQHRNTPTKRPTEGTNRFTEGFVTATMLFCVGSMSILGPIEEGLGETPNILYAKSIMDGISSIALASTFGIAILFSAGPLLIYQGTISLCAAFMSRFMSETMIADLTTVGGILLIGLGINILEIKIIRVTNMLPALIIVIFLSYLWQFF